MHRHGIIIRLVVYLLLNGDEMNILCREDECRWRLWAALWFVAFCAAVVVGSVKVTQARHEGRMLRGEVRYAL